MKTAAKWMKLIFFAAMLVFLVSCTSTSAPYIPTNSTVGKMNVKQARAIIISTLKGGRVDYDGGLFSRCYLISGVRITPTKLVVENESGHDMIFQFNSFSKISYSSEFNNTELDGKFAYCAVNIADALYVLQQNAINAPKEDAHFAASLVDYRNKIASGSALPEEAYKYKVQAEDAIRDKQFDEAAELFKNALDIAPWWSAGHFNGALVLAESKDYDSAIIEMKRYLALVPNAPDARASQNKIYNWERKAEKPN